MVAYRNEHLCLSRSLDPVIYGNSGKVWPNYSSFSLKIRRCELYFSSAKVSKHEFLSTMLNYFLTDMTSHRGNPELLKQFNQSKDMWQILVRSTGTALQYAPEESRSNRVLVPSAVSIHGLSLQYASDDPRNDKQVVLVAIRQNAKALKYASNKLKNDKNVIQAAIESLGTV